MTEFKITPTLFYLITGFLACLAYGIYLFVDKKTPTSLAVCANLCNVVVILILTGLIKLIQNENNSIAWVLAVILFIFHILGLVFSRTVYTVTTNGETKQYTA